MIHLVFLFATELLYLTEIKLIIPKNLMKFENVFIFTLHILYNRLLINYVIASTTYFTVRYAGVSIIGQLRFDLNCRSYTTLTLSVIVWNTILKENLRYIKIQYLKEI